MGMSDNYFYLNSNTILDKEKASWVEEFYTMGTTDKGKITFLSSVISEKAITPMLLLYSETKQRLNRLM